MEEFTINEKNKLKSKTKKQVDNIQEFQKDRDTTAGYTAIVLGLGSINYFTSPTVCSLFLGAYLFLLQADLAKGLFAIKMAEDPLWKWKMKDCGYLLASTFALATLVTVTKRGIARIR